MKKIGIMGGTFDPIHIGHLKIAQKAYEQFDLEHVLFMPAGIPPHKMGRRIASGEDRRKMVELAIRPYPYFACSDMELKREGASYTAKSLSKLCDEYPTCIFYYIVGADSLDYMDEWHHPEIIFQKAIVLAAMRNTEPHWHILKTKDFLKNKYGAVIHFLNCPQIDVSSSELREKIKVQIPIEEKVPADVLAYIRLHHLYQ